MGRLRAAGGGRNPLCHLRADRGRLPPGRGVRGARLAGGMRRDPRSDRQVVLRGCVRVTADAMAQILPTSAGYGPDGRLTIGGGGRGGGGGAGGAAGGGGAGGGV